MGGAAGDLVGVLEEAAGFPAGVMTPERIMSVLRPESDSPGPVSPASGARDIEEHRSLAEAVSADRLVPRLIAQQVVGLLQTLSTANQLRQALGITADESAADAMRAADIGFDLLEHGVAARASLYKAPRRGRQPPDPA